MSFRWVLLAFAAASLVAVQTGCSSDNARSERDMLLQQNAEQKKALDDQNARIAGLTSDLDAARAAAAVGPTTPAITDPGIGPTIPVMSGDTGTAGLREAGISKGTSKKGETQFEIGSDVLFDSGRSALKTDSKKSLDKLVSVLKSQYKTGTLRIEGHTDNIPFKKGSAMTNEKLGQNRAQSVVEYLVAHGIPSSRLKAVSMADKEPKSTTNQALNRRVTVVVAK